MCSSSMSPRFIPFSIAWKSEASSPAYGWRKPASAGGSYYKLTAQGKTVLKEQRNSWAEFVNAIDRITGGEHA